MYSYCGQIFLRENLDVFKSLSVSGFYAIMSGAMAFMNKSLVTSYAFDCPLFILLIQFLLLVVIFELLKFMEIITLPKYSLKVGSSLFFASLCYIASSAFALLCLSGLNIPMYNVLKRLSPLVNLCVGFFILKNYHVPLRVMLAVALITVGSILAGMGDLTFQFDAYFYGIASAACQSVYLLLVQKRSKEDNLSVLDISYVIAVNAFPISLIAIFVFGEISKLQNYHGWTTNGFILDFLSVTLSGTLLVYSQFLCTTVTSALNTSVSSSLKSVLTTFIGFFTFGGVHVNFIGATGILLNTSGGVLYTMFKYLESKKHSSQSSSVKKSDSSSMHHDSGQHKDKVINA